jgi:BolA family transcriptional regulator, general stress-responsive regulator
MTFSAKRLQKILAEALEATHVEVKDESHLHAGHLPQDSEGTHFSVIVISPKFTGLGRVQRHQLVYNALQNEMKGTLHAINIRAITPPEWKDMIK